MFTRIRSRLAICTALVLATTSVIGGTSSAVYANGFTFGAVSVSNAGTPGAQQSGTSGYRALAGSDDGSKVSFLSDASDLDSSGVAATARGRQVYLRDRVSGTTRLVSMTAGGTALNSNVERFRMSANGHWLTFMTAATNMGLGHDSEGFGLYERNLTTGALSWIAPANGAGGQNFAVTDSGKVVQSAVEVTPDGRYVIPVNATGTSTRILDTQTGASRLIATAADGTPADSQSIGTPTVTPDGKFVAFFSGATNLVPDFKPTCPPNNCGAIFLKNMTTGVVTQVAPSSTNTEARPGGSVSLSDDGNLVGFCQAGATMSNDDQDVPDLGAVVYDVSAGTGFDVEQDRGVKLYALGYDCPSVVLGDGSGVLIEGSTGYPAPDQVWVEPTHPGHVVAPPPQARPMAIVAYGSQTYGGSTPTYNVSYDGFIGTDGLDNVSGTLACTTVDHGVPIGPLLSVGEHFLDGYSCSGLSITGTSVVYYITYLSGADFIVAPANLDVTANNKTVTYGQPIPPLTADITGYVNGETAATANVTGAPYCTTTASQGSLPGTYPITCEQGDLAAPNYTFAEHPGSLTITASTSVTGSSSGSVTIGPGQSLYLAPGSTLSGRVTIQPGGAIDDEGGTIKGSLSISGAAATRICGSTVQGSLTITGSPNLILVGDVAGDLCAGNTIRGPVTIRNNTGGVLFNHNTVIGSLVIGGNTGTVPPPDTGPVVAMENTVTGGSSIQ